MLSIWPLLLILTTVTAKIDVAQEKASELHVSQPKVKDAAEHVDHRKVYTELFKLRRREHSGAIESIKKIDFQKRRPFLEEVLTSVSKILLECREKLERIQHAATDPFPHDSETLRDLLSKVVENTAFFSDLSLHFSQFFEKKLAKDRKLKTTVVWAFNYAKDTGLLDPETLDRVNLMAQQHEIVQRSPELEEIEREAYEEMKRKKSREGEREKASEKKRPRTSCK
ncbi:unnamed protein product [Caenorhabditis auriculariae]|uniref:Uncharacterized protein n=1 Tax=Caenorhabditis auriculariae TaxID=2777116 RepID=A0A8S1GSN3_9PELO|nr:unnamed protein product [Caenorhabditis auriculariae]